MTPILSTTGGGSVRGFGRRRPVPSGPSGPSGQPSAVSATAVGTVANASDGRLNLVWSNNGDAASVTRIYNGATLLFTSLANATTYSVTGLNANTSYTLTVKHFLGSIESAGSSFSATTTFDYSGHSIATVTGATAGKTDPIEYYSDWDQSANGNNGYSYGINTYLTTNAGCAAVGSVNGSGNVSLPGGTTSIMMLMIGEGGAGYDGGDPTAGPAGGGGGAAMWRRMAKNPGNIFTASARADYAGGGRFMSGDGCDRGDLSPPNGQSGGGRVESPTLGGLNGRAGNAGTSYIDGGANADYNFWSGGGGNVFNVTGNSDPGLGKYGNNGGGSAWPCGCEAPAVYKWAYVVNPAI